MQYKSIYGAPQRECQSEDEAIALLNAKNRFWRRLGWITAKALQSVPPELRGELEFQLSDASSIYSTNYNEKLAFLESQKKKE